MQPNHEPLKDLVRQYKAAIEPSPAHVEHERARLLARIAAEAPRSDAPPRRRSALLLVGAVAAGLLLAWGALELYIGLRVQQVVDASLAVKQAPARVESLGAVHPGETVSEVVVAPPIPAAEVQVEPEPEEPATPPIVAPEPTTANGPRRRAAAVVDADALLRESALLSQAREAQARGDWPRVLELVDEHRRSHPQGSLLEERLVLEAAAACKAGQRERGERAMQTLQRRFPRSLARARVADICGGEGDE